MNHFSHWPIWLKAGSIALLIAFVFIVFQFVLVPNIFMTTCDGVACTMSFVKNISLFFNYSIYPLWSTPIADLMFNNDGVYAVSSLAYYFLIGTFIGLMIEKKKLKSSKN